jgi:hypothetical protein
VIGIFKKYPALLLILLLSSTLRLIWVIAEDSQPYSDAEDYHQLATGIARGWGYVSEETGRPTAYRPVGYPAFLGGLYWFFGEGYFVGIIANVTLSTFVLLLTYKYALMVFKSDRIALISIAILAIFPNQIVYNSLLLAEILAQSLFMALLILWHRSSLVAGVVLGLLIYVKPIFIFIPLVFFLIAIIGKKPILNSLKYIFTLYIIALAILSPWVYRNYQLFGKLVLVSTNAGINFWIGNNPNAEGDYQEVIVPAEYSQLNEAEEDAVWRGKALDFICEHPLKALNLYLIKIFKIWYSDADGYSANVLSKNNRWIDASKAEYTTSEWIVKWLFQVFYLAIMLLAFWAFTKTYKIYYCDFLIIGYLTLTQAVFLGMPRFHFIVIPLIVIYSAFTLEKLFFKHYETLLQKRCHRDGG